MGCHKNSCFSLTWLLLHALVIVAIGSAFCLKDTKTGKKLTQKANEAGKKLEDKVLDALDKD